MPEAMMQIRKELGSNAVILNSKEITEGGFLGLFKKRKIEVIAALDNEPLQEKEIKENEKKRPIITPSQHNQTEKVLDEIQYLKQMLESQAFHSQHNFSADYELAYQHLIDQEVDEKLAHSLVNSVLKQHEDEKIEPTRESVNNLLHSTIVEQLGHISFDGISFNKKIVQFVGPTGVGKTTTLAKVAAHCMLEHKKKIAFITTDTYRIAAIDQLKTYARILDVPIEVAYSIEDYKQAIQKFSQYDLILVDTAGRNYRDIKYINDLKEMIDIHEEIETYLTLSLTAKTEDIKQIFNQFQSLSIDKVVFTKLDETLSYGSILNICLNYSIGVPYLTNGQDVPDDIIQPNPEYITNLLLSRQKHV